MEEIWKAVPDYEDRYMVSNLGNIKSLYRNGTKGGEVTKVERRGYLRVRLWKNKKVRTIGVHRLVAIVFLPNPNNKPQVNHKDGNKKNNHVENLEWVTASENTQHSYNNGFNQRARPIAQIKNGKEINVFPSIHNAAVKTGIEYVTIYWCVNGIFKQAGGYEWKFKTPLTEK